MGLAGSSYTSKDASLALCIAGAELRACAAGVDKPKATIRSRLSQLADTIDIDKSVELMVRRLKTYQTSVGFYDLAIAAPSMKAAAEAWGSQTDVFRKGFAKETHDPAIVAATMARPGTVLKRPVGSKESFSEHAELPHLPQLDKARERPAKLRPKRKEPLTRKTNDKAAKANALAFQREQKRREAARRKEEAAREKRRKLREQAIAKNQRALERAKGEHERRLKKIEQERATLDKRLNAEEARWDKEKEKLESALLRARD